LSVKEDEEEEEEEDEQLLHTQVIRYIPRVPKKAARDTRKKGFARWLVHLYYVVHAALTAAGAGSLIGAEKHASSSSNTQFSHDALSVC